MVELRKRKTPPPAATEAAAKRSVSRSKATSIAKDSKATAAKAKDTNPPQSAPPEAKPEAKSDKVKEAQPITKSKAPTVGESITIDGFGGEVRTGEDDPTTLKQLLEESKSGVVLFTYPKASTPGCTTQACLFRDSYESLTGTGMAIYGLSTDSPKANTTFKTKQKLPYTLLCDPKSTLIQAIGFKKHPSGTQRGVFVVDKSGKILAVEAGGPQATVDTVTRIVEENGV